MIEKKLKWIGESGLHARPAGQIAARCANFESSITLTNCSNNRVGDARGLFSLMTMELKKDDEFIITAKGYGEEREYKSLIQLLVDYDFIEEGPETCPKSELRRRQQAIDPNAPVILPSYVSQEDYEKYRAKF